MDFRDQYRGGKLGRRFSLEAGQYESVQLFAGPGAIVGLKGGVASYQRTYAVNTDGSFEYAGHSASAGSNGQLGPVTRGVYTFIFDLKAKDGVE